MQQPWRNKGAQPHCRRSEASAKEPQKEASKTNRRGKRTHNGADKQRKHIINTQSAKHPVCARRAFVCPFSPPGLLSPWSPLQRAFSPPPTCSTAFTACAAPVLHLALRALSRPSLAPLSSPCNALFAAHRACFPPTLFKPAHTMHRRRRSRSLPCCSSPGRAWLLAGTVALHRFSLSPASPRAGRPARARPQSTPPPHATQKPGMCTARTARKALVFSSQ